MAGVRQSSQFQQNEAASLVRTAPTLAPGSDKLVLAPFTGLTPPTKEVRRSRSSVTPSQEVQGARRRSLDTNLGATNTTLAAVKDEEIQREFKNYFQRQAIQRVLLQAGQGREGGGQRECDR